MLILINKKEVKVLELRLGNSQEYVHPRVPISGRGSTIYKPPQGNNVKASMDLTTLETHVVPEMTGETVSALELNKEIPHKEAVKLKKKIIHHLLAEEINLNGILMVLM